MKYLLGIVMMGLAASVFALDSLDQWATKIWAQPLQPEKDSASVVMTQEGPGEFKKAAARTTYKVNPDGSYTRDYYGPDETSHSEFLKNGSLASSRADNVKDKKIYSAKISPGRGQASFRTEAKGKGPSSKTLALKPNNIIMPEYLNLIRQAWQNGLRGGFAFKGLSPDGSMQIDMETRLIETRTPWNVSDKYEIPADFKAAFPDTQKYVVADFCLGGMFSVMYKFHNYWIFRIAPSGLEYSGSFGGDPKKATYTFLNE